MKRSAAFLFLLALGVAPAGAQSVQDSERHSAWVVPTSVQVGFQDVCIAAHRGLGNFEKLAKSETGGHRRHGILSAPDGIDVPDRAWLMPLTKGAWMWQSETPNGPECSFGIFDGDYDLTLDWFAVAEEGSLFGSEFALFDTPISYDQVKSGDLTTSRTLFGTEFDVLVTAQDARAKVKGRGRVPVEGFFIVLTPAGTENGVVDGNA